MSSSVESSQSVSSLSIDLSLDLLSNCGFIYLLVKVMKETLANFGHVKNFVVFSTEL